MQYVSGRGRRADCSIDDFSIEQSDRLLEVVDVQQAHNLNSDIRLTFKVKINCEALTKLGKKRKVVKEPVKIPSSPPVTLQSKSPALVLGKGAPAKLRLEPLL